MASLATCAKLTSGRIDRLTAENYRCGGLRESSARRRLRKCRHISIGTYGSARHRSVPIILTTVRFDGVDGGTLETADLATWESTIWLPCSMRSSLRHR